MDNGTSCPKRLLWVNGGLMNRGGIESFMMNYYRHFDRSQIQIDFIVHQAYGFGYYDEEIRSLGGRIYVLPQKSKHPISYTMKLKKILRSGNYKIIHTHMDAMGAWVLKVAKGCGIPVRIAHSHNTQHLTSNPIKLYFLEKARKNIVKYATHRMACGEDAGRWLFGNEQFDIIHNAIETQKFAFSQHNRETARKTIGVSDSDFVIGHVGRFDTQKNHPFLIELFDKVVRNHPQAKLILIGEGPNMEAIRKDVSMRNLNDKVIFTGVRDDVHLLYNAFDLFVLPSLFEGLVIVGVEAQINGCPCVFSNKVPAEVKLSDNVTFMELDIDAWKKEIGKAIQNRDKRRKAGFDISDTGYDIEKESVKLQNKYLDLWIHA